MEIKHAGEEINIKCRVLKDAIRDRRKGMERPGRNFPYLIGSDTIIEYVKALNFIPNRETH